MRVGSSPLYLLQGQEFMLERFAFHLKSKEKDAYALLKEKKFLEDFEQEPAIRVALREIKDFAIPMKRNEKLVWKFFSVNEFDMPKEKGIKIKEEISKIEEIPIKKIEKEENFEKTLDIFDKPKIKRTKKPKKGKRKSSQKDNTFFNKVKEFLSEKSLELIDIISFNKNEILIKIREENKEKILVAYNKKKISDLDIIKASKKILGFNLPYDIVCLEGPLKKVQDIITATKNLGSIEKLK